MNATFFDDWDAAPAPAPAAAQAGGAALAPVRADDKRVIGGKADINQLAPFKYPWAWEFFLNANRNHWTPLEISMAQARCQGICHEP